MYFPWVFYYYQQQYCKTEIARCCWAEIFRFSFEEHGIGLSKLKRPEKQTPTQSQWPYTGSDRSIVLLRNLPKHLAFQRKTKSWQANYIIYEHGNVSPFTFNSKCNTKTLFTVPMYSECTNFHFCEVLSFLLNFLSVTHHQFLSLAISKLSSRIKKK